MGPDLFGIRERRDVAPCAGGCYGPSRRARSSGDRACASGAQGRRFDSYRAHLDPRSHAQARIPPYPASMFRSALVAAVVLFALVAATSRAPSSTISPCTAVRTPVWSPDGQQIAFYATRWPPPTANHRTPNDILQALCTANADGTNAQPLRSTVCNSKCPDPPYQLAWLRPDAILFLRDGDILQIAPGSKPRK